MRRRLIRSLCLALALLGLAASPAAAAPILNLDIHHNETHFPPGGTAEYWIDVANVGDAPTTSPLTLTIKLPSGSLSRDSVRNEEQGGVFWKCPGFAGQTTVTCTNNEPLARHSLSSALILVVDVAKGASGDRFTTAQVSGGGAAKGASAIESTRISATPAPFGVVEGSWNADFYQADALTPVREASSHPERATFAFDLNSVAAPLAAKPNQKAPAESLRNLRVSLPEGFLGNPTAVGECTPAELSFGTCPRSSQVGRVTATIMPATNNDFWTVNTGIYNMVHPRGTISDLAFQYAGVPLHIKASLDPANHYAIVTSVTDVNETLPPFHNKVTIWGVPADPSHDSERCGGNAVKTEVECPTDQAVKPFLTLPSACGGGKEIELTHYDSWQSTGLFGPELNHELPGEFSGCELPRFEPEVQVEPTGSQANTPTGLDVHIKVAQNENPDALATPPMRSTVVTLPRGMSFSPSFADGLQSCSLAQMKLGTNAPVECPDASRVGEVDLTSPLLPGPLKGSMYLAAQGDNPFGSLFALYLVLRDTEERGVLVKIPGRIDVDPVTGQIVTTFDELPQFPFDDLTLKFRSGPRAPLVSPPSCGTQAIGVKVTSWAQPQSPLDLSNAYQVSEGPNGTPCPAGDASRPFSPAFVAGTLNPTAGAYSPFLFRLSRADQEQELSQVKAILPPGLVARIAGVPPCPEAAITSISTALGAGGREQASPACPAASQIGTLSAGLGAGPGPNYFPGKVYLAGPYKGAPLSLVVVAPGLAGPFDLGNVVVRTALRVDSRTAQVTAVSDPFPTILHGVLLRVRDVRIRVDRPQTTINPTSCEATAVGGEITGVGGNLLNTADDFIFSTSSPFQAGECASLSFKPKLSFRLFGGTMRGAHPKLRATLKMPAGGANIARASVALPPSEFLDQGHIKTICTRVQFAAEACPAASIYGEAVANTPLLDEPLSGPVYLRASDNLLPDLVADLRGRIDVEVVGRIDSKNRGIRTTFDIVPDAPVSSFTLTMQGGKKGLLINSTDICKRTHRATARFSAHNGMKANLRPALRGSCGKSSRGNGRKR